MKNKRDSKKSRMGAVVIALLFIGTALHVPVSTLAANSQSNPKTTNDSHKNYYTQDGDHYFVLDRSYYLLDPEPALIGSADNDDAGYKKMLELISHEP